jgi:hypothetical protein
MGYLPCFIEIIYDLGAETNENNIFSLHPKVEKGAEVGIKVEKHS